MDELTKKYVDRINAQFSSQENSKSARPELSTKQYKEFKEQYQPKHHSAYERACNMSAKLISISPNQKDRSKVEEAISTCHLDTTPEGVTAFSIVAPIIIILFFILIGFIIPITYATMTGAENPAEAGSLFVMFFGIIAGASLIIPLQRLPYYLANSWRMKASNQMVLCTFYIVTYMRHTSNLELAIDFAGEHLAPPLSLDMKKIIWDLETQKYDSVKESLDSYLETWKETNQEFIESMHLIEGSLLETSESRRVEMLDKSLSVMLDETYEKMLHYAHNLKSPLTTLHMLGVILPILGLVILPLLVNFMPDVQWYHIALFYNVALPILVYMVAKSILSTRPSGYGNADITDINPELKKYKNVIIPFGGKDTIEISPAILSIVIVCVLLLIAITPFIYHLSNPESDWVIDQNGLHVANLNNPDEYKDAKVYFLDYRPIGKTSSDVKPADRVLGPFGLGAVLASLMMPLAIGLGVGVYFSLRSRNIIKIREDTKRLEEEFASGLFQLGNRLADGIPAELAFPKVAEVLQGTRTGHFFEIVTINISKLGMSVEDAIFDPQHGAIRYYPSNVIESSMKVLVESNKKGPLIASRALINVSEYIKQMHRVDERLRDLMSDVISSMKSQISFLTPVIAGVVIGITSMIANILGLISSKLGALSGELGSQAGGAAGVGVNNLIGGGGIPTYHFQAIVGLYVVQITFILTIMVNGIENGVDAIGEQEMLGKNLIRATLLYVAVAAITIILFSFISSSITVVGG